MIRPDTTERTMIGSTTHTDTSGVGMVLYSNIPISFDPVSTTRGESALPRSTVPHSTLDAIAKNSLTDARASDLLIVEQGRMLVRDGLDGVPVFKGDSLGAAENERDEYFDANLADLITYDGDDSLYIRLEWKLSHQIESSVLFQRRTSSEVNGVVTYDWESAPFDNEIRYNILNVVPRQEIEIAQFRLERVPDETQES